jgi:hypothetical protein
MNTKSHSSKSVIKCCRWLVALASGLLVGHSALAAVTFTITPSVVSNTYSGLITLSIGGLTNTETVVVQKFLDLNTNGVIDGTDWLVQQFTLQDGTNFVIGGVTNFNVPGDLNATTGAVTAQLNFQNGDFVQNIIGKYLFKLSSPVGHFAPLTNQFAVTNFPFPQKFTGNVVSNGTSTTLSNAVVLLMPGPDSSPVAGAVANNAGSYTIQVPAGTYLPVAFRSNYLCNFSTPPVIALGGGATITTNLILTNATASISGRVVDAANSSLGLPGIMLPMQSTNGLMGIGFTDTNGNFSVGVRSGQWKVKGDDTTLIVHGYLGLQNGTNVTAGATGVTLTVPKATALIYGSVKDNLGNPLVGLDVYANDNNNLYQTDGYTDASGNYVLGVLGLGSSDSWYVQANGNNQLTNYIFTQENINGNINAGQAVLQNFTAALATNYIIGNVKFNGNPIGGVGVWASATINSVDYFQYVNADGSGNYSLNVANGSWTVGLETCCGNSSLDGILGSGNYQSPTNQSATINNNNATNKFRVQSCGGVQILTTSLPDGQVGSYYNQFLQGSTCSGTLNWSLNDPQNFPSSLGWSGNGNIQGTPNSSGMYNFSVQLDDGNGHSTNQNLSLYIAPVYTPPVVTTTSLPNGTNGTFYTQTIQASGGQTPYSWFIPDYSAAPANLSLATNGVLSGTLADTADTHYFDVVVTDAAANSSTQTLSLTIVNPPLPPLVITNVSLPNGNVGAAYSAQLGTTGGQSPYFWSYALGSINLSSVGLSLSPSGLISGTPTTNKVPTFKVQVSDSNPGLANTTTKVLSIIINPQPLLGSPTWLTNQFQMRLIGASNQNYTVQMSTNLSSTNWISLFITNNTTTNSFLLTDPNATNQQRFYRILIGQ